ncbi:glycosyltransferase family 39 protein [Dyella thiooxydans]|uniref:glycosyltransferase family 39 protein n=1 Tax=Dyella thiooxydans TaxID=445710 RepID=UPI0007C4ECC9|nr:glycosyltransferase family 39 protein [Dyella thiooxydans]
MMSAHSGAPAHRTVPVHVERAGLLSLLVTLLWGVAWIAGLMRSGLGEPDEGRYAEVAREMLASGDWITPRLDGFLFFDKPPLHYWGTAAAYALLGTEPWVARLWGALAGLLAIAAVAWAGWRVWGRATGFYAATILGSSLLFAVSAHVGTLDLGVAAFLALGMACFVVAQFDPASASHRTAINLGMWAALALAVLSKGLIGVVLPGMVLAVYMLWQRDWRVLGRVSLLPGLVLLLVVSAPWFIEVTRRHPEFFDYFFIREHFTRFLTSADNRGKPPGFFLPVVLLGLFPWTALVPFTRLGWRAMWSGAPVDRLLLAWVGVVFVFFSISHSQLPFYILPLFPAAALLLGRIAARLPHEALARRMRVTAWAAAIGAAAALAAALMQRHHPAHAGMPTALGGLAASLAIMAFAAGYATRRLTRHRHHDAAMHALALAGIVGWTITLLASQAWVGPRSGEPVARLMAPALTVDTPVYMVGGFVRGLPFYLERPVTIVAQDRDDLTPFIDSRPGGYLPTLEAFEARWRTSAHGVALVDAHAMAVLQQHRLPYVLLGRLPTGFVIARQPAR